MNNAETARALEEVADVLEIRGATPSRIRAYRNAVRTIDVLAEPLARRLAAGPPLADLPGIGREMESHIRELVSTGTLADRDRLLAKVPRSLVELMRLPGLGAKKARQLWTELAITSVDELEQAAQPGRIARPPGLRAQSQQKTPPGDAA